MPRHASSSKCAATGRGGRTRRKSRCARGHGRAGSPVPSESLDRAGLSRSSDGSYLLSDAFLFRQKVDSECRDSSKAEELVAALGDAWSDPESLRAALQPTRAPPATGSGTTSSSLFGDSGIKDSVVRLLLQCTNVQTLLACHLLQALVQDHQEELEDGGSHAGMPLAKLVLSQFRWLEHVADGAGELLLLLLSKAFIRYTTALHPALRAQDGLVHIPLCSLCRSPATTWTPG